jgi:hypothetical protein
MLGVEEVVLKIKELEELVDLEVVEMVDGMLLLEQRLQLELLI